MLPIGSIVYLAEENQKVMILNRGQLVEQQGEKVFFDYTGALYPQGLDPEEVYYFNREDIEDVVFEGFKDEEEIHFVILYNKWINKNEGRVKKGKADFPRATNKIYRF